MAKNYVILNFTDYSNRSTPVTTLATAFERRVERKGGSFRIHHMADLFGDIRLARHKSSFHHKHHVKASLNEGDIRSSLAFKVFCGLSEFRPHIRLTARTGAVSAEEVGTSLTSETEEAIIAAEEMEAHFGGKISEDLVGAVRSAHNEFDKAITTSTLSKKEQNTLRDRLDRWFMNGFDPKELDRIIEAIDQLDWSHRNYGASLFWAVGLNPTWSEAHKTAVSTLRDLAPRRQQLQQLHAISKQSQAKYGKFIYERDQNEIVVSRWIADQLVQVARLNG